MANRDYDAIVESLSKESGTLSIPTISADNQAMTGTRILALAAAFFVASGILGLAIYTWRSSPVGGLMTFAISFIAMMVIFVPALSGDMAVMLHSFFEHRRMSSEKDERLRLIDRAMDLQEIDRQLTHKEEMTKIVGGHENQVMKRKLALIEQKLDIENQAGERQLIVDDGRREAYREVVHWLEAVYESGRVSNADMAQMKMPWNTIWAGKEWKGIAENMLKGGPLEKRGTVHVMRFDAVDDAISSVQKF